MNRKIIFLAILSLVVSGCSFGASGNTSNNSQNESNSIPVLLDEEDILDEYSIRLTSPQLGQVLKSPFLVGGEANLPGNIAYIRVKSPSGEVVISEQVSIKPSERDLKPFGVLISFVFQATNQGTVEVYGIDPKTNQEVALKSIDVNFDTSSSGSAKIPN